MSEVVIFTARDEARIATAICLRIAVFVDEQGVPLEEEVDEHDRADDDARHALITAPDGRGLATGRYFRRDETVAQIGRLAVARDARGRGFGRAILDALIVDARTRAFRSAALSAQDHAIGFYEHAGFRAYGDTYMECGIVHQAMDRVI